MLDFDSKVSRIKFEIFWPKLVHNSYSIKYCILKLLFFFKTLDVLEIFCYFGLCLSGYIIIKLLLLGRTLNFINILFINMFLSQMVLGFFMTKNFFFVSRMTWTSPDEIDFGALKSTCGYW